MTIAFNSQNGNGEHVINFFKYSDNSTSYGIIKTIKYELISKTRNSLEVNDIKYQLVLNNEVLSELKLINSAAYTAIKENIETLIQRHIFSDELIDYSKIIINCKYKTFLIFATCTQRLII